MHLIISGHQRSGTTLLRRLCDGHPQMKVANEFGCFADMGLTVRQAWAARWAQWRLVNGRWAFDSQFATDPRRHWHNFWFTLRYGWHLAQMAHGPVTVEAVAGALEMLWPETAVVGDKLPQYMPLLPQLSKNKESHIVVIYRDCRDVTSSFLEKVRTVWRTREWAKEVDTAEKIAANWVNHIVLMEKLADDIHIIQYEQLVQEPEHVLNGLASWLDVDPAGFKPQTIKMDSLGKHRKGLTEAELAEVTAVAGPTMRRLGYK
ncbi:sulfotransferase family protein [Candidatus Leptofilum sp.]|uniref:sulfotransferase family protein n=1 Tax=Candidatus Leptofilum sp. TaxID=3241576 RepID=UPI003B58C5D0